MRSRLISATSVLALAVAALGCGARGPARPTREAVTASLQQIANTLKSDGEKLDPMLRQKATWTIEGLDVTERADDAEKPWAGAIRFKVQSETKDIGDAVVRDESQKKFDYIYSMTVNGWILQMQ